MTSSLTTLVGDDLGDRIYKWSYSIYCTTNEHVYGIPHSANRVLKFNPTDKSSTRIGPDLGDDEWKYRAGTEDEKGCIYCSPCDWSDRGMLKIDTHNDTVTILTARPPERSHWTEGALGLDGNIYFMPQKARRILKLNTDTDTFESVGDDLGKGYGKYWGAVRGIDGCIYGIPYRSNRIVKYDPVSQVTSYVGEKHTEDFMCTGSGALARDGCIYAATGNGRVFKINTKDNDNSNDTLSWAWVGNRVDTNHSIHSNGWGDAIMGIDGCIYWPPKSANRTLKHNPHIDHTSLVGDNIRNGSDKYRGGALAPDGVIYCMPLDARHILAIDPFREFTEAITSDMRKYPPEEIGGLFQIGEGGITNFESAILKFGLRGFQTIVDHLPPANEVIQGSNHLYPFMAAASLPNSALSAIYHLFRQVPGLVIAQLNETPPPGASRSEEDEPTNKKQKMR